MALGIAPADLKQARQLRAMSSEEFAMFAFSRTWELHAVVVSLLNALEKQSSSLDGA